MIYTTLRNQGNLRENIDVGERTIGQRDCGSVETDRRQSGCRIANEKLSSVG